MIYPSRFMPSKELLVGINGESFKFDRKLGTATSQINATGFKFKTGYECGSVSAKEQKKYFGWKRS